MGNLYHQLASEIISQIDEGVYHVGDKLPGVRAMGLLRGVSPTTVVAAYDALSNGGYIESRPRSGFYIAARTHVDFAVPAISQPVMMPKAVTGQEMVLKLIQQTLKPGVINLGAAGPDFSILPSAMIEKVLAKNARTERANMCRYEFPPGNIELRRALAKRMARWGCNVTYEDIVITNGCQEAIFLTLMALAQPGDAIAVESPAYYGLLQIIETLSLKAIEIPTDPVTGIAIDALQLAFDHWPIKACLVVSNFSNPLGASMNDEKKQALVNLCRKNKVTLIEDDIYGDVGFGSRRPGVCRRFDEKVIYCSSFSKSLAPGLRIGWVASKQLAAKLAHLKFTTSAAATSITQIATAEILESGKYDRHLRGMRSALAKSMREMILAIERYFPTGTCITQPQGGFVLWVELPQKNSKQKSTASARALDTRIDTFKIALQLSEENIAIAPGKLFSSSQKYNHCLRLSTGGNWTAQKEKALKRVGEVIKAYY